MKRIFLVLVLVILSVVSRADITLRFDSSVGMTYVNIQPLQWTRNQPQVTRLYIIATSDDLKTRATIYWELRATIILDSVTTRRPIVASGYDIISGVDYSNWDPESKYLFNYEAAPGKLNIEIID